MDGVTVLAIYTHRELPLFAVVIFGILLVFFSIKMIFELYKKHRRSQISIEEVIEVAFISLFMIGILIILCKSYLTINTDYTVRIDDSVSYIELTEQYEILSNNGDTYTIRKIKE